MTTQSDMAGALASTLAATQGESIVYKTKNKSGRVTSKTTITDAIVTERRREPVDDEDASFLARAIDVQIQVSSLSTVNDGDAITWDGFDWVIDESQSSAAVHLVVAVRHERQRTTGSAYRHNRRIPDAVNIG